jgi:pyruvate,water dikinase
MARHDARCRALLTAGGWEPSLFRSVLQDTDFLRSFDRYIEDYGHRGMGESDIMSPRFADQPELVLEVLRMQLRTPGSGSPSEIVARQAAVRNDAVREIKKRFGRRVHQWVIFSWWYRRLCRYSALREANRHHLMYYSLAARSLLLRAGTLFVEHGLFDQAEDIFFIRLEEQEHLFSGIPRDWRALIRSRRAERLRNVEVRGRTSVLVRFDAGEPVRMKHLLQAARCECFKLERPPTEAELGGWT